MSNTNDEDTESLNARIQVLEAREALKELKAQYARRADAVFNTPGAASATALADLFTEDGVLDLGPFGSFEGRAALLDAFENVLPLGTQWSTHYMMNPELTVDGETATGHWYYLIQSLPAGAEAHLIQIFGSYDDTYERVAGSWKIKRSSSGFFMPPTPG